MTILSGRDGSVLINNTLVYKCINWSGSLSRQFVSQTTHGSMDIDSLPAKRSFTGTIQAYRIISNDPSLVTLYDNFLEDFPDVVQIELWTDTERSHGLVFNAYMESISSRASVSAASAETYTVASTGTITSTL